MGRPQTQLLPALSHTAPSVSLSSKVTRLLHIRADLVHRQPRTCKVGEEVAEPVPAPRTLMFSEAEAGECFFPPQLILSHYRGVRCIFCTVVSFS